MSGSFYSLNAQYNSLLAILETLEQDKVAQDLENVLTIGNNGGGLDMTNVNAITVGTLNYTTLNPAVPEVIGNISQVLAVGNDATNKNIINLGSVSLKAGGGGSLTFQDGSVQSVAFTGVAATLTLDAVITAGSSAGNQNITALQGIISPSTLPISIAGLNGQDINLVAFPQGINPSGVVKIQTNNGVINQDWTFLNNGSLTAPSNSAVNFGGGSSVQESGLNLQLNGGSGDVNIQGDVVLQAGGGGSIFFQDGSEQSIAYNGQVSNLNAVLSTGNDGGGQNIINVGAFTTNVASNSTTNITGNQITTSGSLTGQIGNITTILDPITTQPSTTYSFTDPYALTTQSAFISNDNLTITGTGVGSGDFTIYTDNNLILDATNGVNFSDNPITGLTVISSDGTLTIQTNVAGLSSDWDFNSQLTFPDSSSQSTAYLGVPTLSSVLNVSNDASNSSIIGVNSITFSGGLAVQNQAYTGVPSLSSVLLSGMDAGGSSIINVNNISPTLITFPDSSVQITAYTGSSGDQDLTSVLGFGSDGGNVGMSNIGNISSANWSIFNVLSGTGNDMAVNSIKPTGNINLITTNAVGGPFTNLTLSEANGANLYTSLDMNNHLLEGVSNIVIPVGSNDIIFTDNVETRIGSGLVLLGTNIGTCLGNYSVVMGVSPSSLGSIATSSVLIGTNVASQGSGIGSIGIGTNAGGSVFSNAQQGDGAISIGANSGAGNGSSQSSGAVSIGNSAGGYGMNSNAISIGTNSGRGTLSTVPQGSNSICIGLNAGLGYGSGGVPSNSLTVSAIRTSTTASNFLTYNTTTEEVSNIASINITPTTFAIGNNTGVGAGNNTFAAGFNTGNNAGVNSYALGINSGNNTGGNQTSIGEACGNNAEQSVCIGLNAGNGTFNATCIGLSAGSVGLGANSVAIGTNASPTNGSADSICIVGNGITVNPPNEGLFIAPIRSAVSATNQLTYNTTTKEIQYAPSGGSGGLTYVSTTFSSVPLSWGFGGSTFTGGGLVLSAGTWAITGFYSIVSGSAAGGQVMNGSSFYFSNGVFQYGSLSTDLYTTETTINTSLTKTHNISYIVTIPSTQTMIGETTVGGYSGGLGINGSGAFYAIKLA